MTAVTSKCPNCGAPVTFRWSQSVQTTCAFCSSVIVRHDVDLERMGSVGLVPAGNSPIQIGTEGMWRDKAFTVTGRIVYEYENGSWNEWHLILTGGASAWLSDAQSEYALSRLVEKPGDIPNRQAVRRGQHYPLAGEAFEVMTLTRAHYRGVEGELPFEYWDKTDALFVDLRATSGTFATIDYSEEPPLVFVGELAEFGDLRLRNLRQIEGW